MDLDVPYMLNITYIETRYTFYITYNNEALDPYLIPTQQVYFGDVTAYGQFSIDYIGFPLLGKTPEVPVGTTLIFKCPEEHRLHRDWFAPPIAKIECLATGKFNVVPEFWGRCILRE